MATALSTAVILSVKQLGHGPLATLDPFLFFVYHKDHYPAGGPDMEVVGRRGNGADFNPAAPYRFYHGDAVPGFPQHPHRGFETLTATIEGIIDHADSLKNHGRYGKGDLQCVRRPSPPDPHPPRAWAAPNLLLTSVSHPRPGRPAGG